MRTSEVVQWVWRELDPLLMQHGYELVEAEYMQLGGIWVLRLFIDKVEGVTLDDCQSVSRLVNPVLDAAEGLAGRYALEVSSPGFDRPIRRPRDFERFTGERVKMRTHAPVAGRKRFCGVLKSFKDGVVALDCEGTVYEINVDNLQRANRDR